MPFKSYLYLFALFLLIGGCTPAPEPTADPQTVETIRFRLPMGYIADPQYAPLYVAKERGYFAEEGFEVEFDYSFETDGVQLVATGDVPFALVSGDVVLLARSEGLPILYVMEWWQKYPIAVVSKTAAGITQPDDLIGRTVGIPGLFGASYVGYAALLEANTIPRGEVTLDEIGFNQIEGLLTDQVEAAVVYANNELVQLTAMGEDVSTLYISDYIDLVANGLITNEQFAAENPERVRGFLRAFLRGLRETLDDPDEAFAISQNYVEDLDDERRAVLDATLPMWEAEQLGQTDLSSWENTQQILLDVGLMEAPLETLTDVYTNEFLSP